MKHRHFLEKLLRQAKKDLIRNKAIDSPVYYIKSRQPHIPLTKIHPQWHDAESKVRLNNRVKEMCHELDAKEVFWISDSYLLNINNKHEKKDCLTACIEDTEGIEIIALPYKMDKNGKITFGKKVKVCKKEKYPAALSEGLVQ